jgi:excisionase family DNA binding protein
MRKKRKPSLAVPAGVSTSTEPAAPLTTRSLEAAQLSRLTGSRPEPEGLLTSPEVLKRLQISRRTLCAYVAKGLLPSIKIGKLRRFHWPSVEGALLRMQRS